MQWTPLIEIEISGVWTILPVSAFAGGIEVDQASGESTTMTMTILRTAAPANPSDWFLYPVRVSFVTSGITKNLFEGLIRSTKLDVVKGFVEYQCASPTRQFLVSSPDVFTTLEEGRPWPTYVFGDRASLTREQQFEKLLDASNFVVSSNGLQSIDELLKFHKSTTDQLGATSSYDVFHEDKDVIAKESPNGGVGSAVTVDFSEPKIAKGANPLAPTASTAEAPINKISCIVRHRFKRLVQEVFNFQYTGGNIITDHVEHATFWLTLQALDDAIAASNMAVVYRYVEPPPLYGNVSSGADPVFAGAAPGVRGALVQTFNISLARRYIQECEYVYEREVRCDASQERYGEKAEKVEITIADETDWTPFTSRVTSPSFAGAGFRDVRTASDFVAFGKVGKATKEAAEQALDVLVRQASKRIKVAHAAALSKEIGSTSVISTSYTTPLTLVSANTIIGLNAALKTKIWTVSGVVANTVTHLNENGSANMRITLKTSNAPNPSFTVVAASPDSSVPIPASKGYFSAYLSPVFFGGVLP